MTLAPHSPQELDAGRSPIAYVAASVGSYGAYLADGSEYSGKYALQDAALQAWHEPRLLTLCESGADLLAMETIPVLREAKCIIAALPENSPPAWVAFSCMDGILC